MVVLPWFCTGSMMDVRYTPEVKQLKHLKNGAWETFAFPFGARNFSGTTR